MLRSLRAANSRLLQPVDGAGFRADIEGLRGVAVLLVLLYHAGVQAVPGGYIGVDVFFVLSGYLITGIIARQVDDGTWSFGTFYLRRIRRLAPALLATIGLTLVASALVLTPSDLERTGAAALYALVGLSNIHFWMGSGYFDPGADVKPLLHTWSLGVEEQFYLLWPAVVVLVWRWRSVRALLIAGVAAVSLIGSVLLLDEEPSAVFYLTPFRAFEFALGAMLVSVPARWRKPAMASAVVLGGLGMIVGAAAMYTRETAFPGFAALVPAIGTAMVISAAPNAGWARWLLVNRPVRWIGRISYSVYLVHWPLVVLWIYAFGAPSTVITCWLVGASLAAGWVLYRQVEFRFRNPARRDAGQQWAFVSGCAASALAFAVIAGSIWGDGGWRWRLPPHLQELGATTIEENERYLWSRAGLYSRTKLFADGNNVVVYGDSQAADILNMLHENGAGQYFSIKYVPVRVECGALLLPAEERDDYYGRQNRRTAGFPDIAAECVSAHERLEALRELEHADLIVLASLWSEQSVAHLRTTIGRLQALSTAKVLVAGRKDLRVGSERIALEWDELEGLEQYAATRRRPETERINQMLQAEVGDAFLDVMAYVCPLQSRCVVLADSRLPVFFDNAHLSRDGARVLGAMLLETIRSRIAATAPDGCIAGVTLMEPDRWHRCERNRRWLSTTEASLRVDVPQAASQVILHGYTYGTRTVKVTMADDILYSGPIDATNPAVLAVPRGTRAVLRLAFDGGPAVSPAALGLSEDTRPLVFMLTGVTMKGH